MNRGGCVLAATIKNYFITFSISFKMKIQYFPMLTVKGDSINFFSGQPLFDTKEDCQNWFLKQKDIPQGHNLEINHLYKEVEKNKEVTTTAKTEKKAKAVPAA